MRPGPRDQFAALVPVRERVSGAEDRDTLAARYHLARWTGEAGDAAGARDQLAGLLPVFERVAGAGDPGGPGAGRELRDALTVRRELARWTGEAGDAAGARDQLAELLPVVKEALGGQHPDTLAVQRQLGHWKGNWSRGD